MGYNDIYFNNLIKDYPNISGLNIENNVLKYQNNSLPLGNFSIASLFANQYGDLLNDLPYLSANDLFSLIYIHVMSYQNNDKLLKNFKIVSKNPKETNLVTYYQDFLYYMLRYEDYLTTDLRDFLSSIIQKVSSSEYRGYYNYDELDFNKKFYELNNRAEEDKRIWQEKKQKSHKLSLSKNNGSLAGFANAFVVILTTLFFAIIIASTLFVLLY